MASANFFSTLNSGLLLTFLSPGPSFCKAITADSFAPDKSPDCKKLFPAIFFFITRFRLCIVNKFARCFDVCFLPPQCLAYSFLYMTNN